MKKRLSCILVFMLLICAVMPTAAFAETESIDFGSQLQSILPEALETGYAEKTFMVDGEEHKVSVKLEELDDEGNPIGLTTMEPVQNVNARAENLGFYSYKATAGSKSLTFSYEGELESVMKLTTYFTISDGLTTFTNMSNDVYMIPITGFTIESEDTLIEEHTYRSFTSYGRMTMAAAGAIPVTVYMEAFFYLDYPIAGDWNQVYFTVNVTGDAT